MKRRHALIGLALAAGLSLSLTGCTGTTDDPGNTDSPEGPSYTIGVATFVDHAALQAVQDGFTDVLDEAGIQYTLVTQNALGDMANTATIASSFAANDNLELILAITTPIAQTMVQAVQDRPILFSAVTDPVDAGLVPSWDQAGDNITGTSDLNPNAFPVELTHEAMPEATTIGILYSSSEPNSITQVRAYEEEAAGLGVTLKPQAVTSPAEISVGLESLSDVDAILVPNDNTIVAAIEQVISFGIERQIPVFCADPSTIERGSVAARGADYYQMGRRTGEMAISILRDGVSVSAIAPEAPTSNELFYSTANAAAFGLTLPEGLLAKGSEA